MAQIQPFILEPEYSSDEEIPELCESNEDELEVLNKKLTGSRLQSSAWCACVHCEEMTTEIECVCCREMKNLQKLAEGLDCVTHHANFSSVCLNKDVIWTALVSLHDRDNSSLPNRQSVPNRSYRYAAYRQFTWWAHGWLGKKVHRVIPACVVKRIRAEFPEPDGNYTGYKRGDDEQYANELEEAWRDFLNL